MGDTKRRRGDRKDGALMRDMDAMHYIMPIIYPNRCDNEAFIAERIDLTRTNEYLAKRNAMEPMYKYNLFQILVTAMAKTLTLRPKMNRFIANKNMYQRNEVSASFVVKKEFQDEGGEGLAFITFKPGDTLDTVHNMIFEQVRSCRSDAPSDSNGTDDTMELLNKMPRFLSRALVNGLCMLDRHGKIPQSIIENDPYYSSILLTNLGSLDMKTGYHHLTNWGTNSVFVAIGKAKKTPEFDDEGNVTMRDTVDLGLTIDERLADGFYYAKSIKILKALIENPELLEARLDEKVDI